MDFPLHWRVATKCDLSQRAQSTSVLVRPQFSFNAPPIAGEPAGERGELLRYVGDSGLEGKHPAAGIPSRITPLTARKERPLGVAMLGLQLTYHFAQPFLFQFTLRTALFGIIRTPGDREADRDA